MKKRKKENVSPMPAKERARTVSSAGWRRRLVDLVRSSTIAAAADFGKASLTWVANKDLS